MSNNSQESLYINQLTLEQMQPRHNSGKVDT